MKSASIIATAFLVSQSFLLAFPQLSNAQQSCQGTVNQVTRQIRAKGVPQVRTNVYRGTANENRTGNPTNRKDVLYIGMVESGINTYNSIQNIFSSPALMKSWVNSILRSCGGTAVVEFYVDGTDEGIVYAVQEDLSAQVRECVEYSDNQIYPWNGMYCP